MNIDDMIDEDELAQAKEMVAFFKSAIMDSSKSLKGKEMDARYNEIALAPVLAEIIRNDVAVRPGASDDSVDIGFAKTTPENVVKMITDNGQIIAEIFHSGTSTTSKSQLTELGATILICCRMMLEKIATDLTSEQDRMALVVASAHLVGDTMTSMIEAMDKPADLSVS